MGIYRVLSVYACILFALSGQVFAGQFANPLDVRIADPQVFFENGTYYLYGTSGGGGFKVWTSDDLVNWRDRGWAFRSKSDSWGKTKFWAPEVCKHNGNYYLFYSSEGTDGIKRICVAKASSPLGSFADIAAPLFDNNMPYLDAHVFVDTDNQPYLFCTRGRMPPNDANSYGVVAKLNDAFDGIIGNPTLCISPSQSWEFTSPGSSWNEGLSVVKHNGYYYMFYSGNVYSSPNYAIGYATATNPMGPWTKYGGNPIVRKTSSVSGPGHCSWIKSPDGQQYWMVYHTQQQLSGGGERQLAIDKFTFVDQPSGPDRLVVPGAPSSGMQAAPSGTPPFPVGGSDEFNAGSVDRGKWIVFNENGANHAFTSSAFVITTVDGDIYEDTRANWQNIFLQYPPSDDFEVTIKLNFTPAENYEQAALFAWQDHNNYLRFADASIAGHLRFEIGVETKADFVSQQVQHNLAPNLWMRLKKVDNTYTCYSSPNGSTWSQVGSPKTTNLIDLKIGFGAASPNSGRNIKATFDYFRVEPLPSGIDDWNLY